MQGLGNSSGVAGGSRRQGWTNAFSVMRPGSPEFVREFADLLREFDDLELAQLGDAMVHQLAERQAKQGVDEQTLVRIRARLGLLIEDVVQRQLVGPKSDRVPAEFEAGVENYFRRLSEDTGEEEEDGE